MHSALTWVELYKKDSIVITIVLTAQFEEAGQEFECALHEMLVSRGMILDYKKTDGDVITIVAKKLSTGIQLAPEMDGECEAENEVSVVTTVTIDEPEECDQHPLQCDTAAAPMLTAKILSISSLNGIPCMMDRALENSCLYVKKMNSEPEAVTFSHGNFIYRYPKARPSAPLQQGVCNPTHAVGQNTICCAVILPGTLEAVNMLLTLVQCGSEQDEEYLHLGKDVCISLDSAVGA